MENRSYKSLPIKGIDEVAVETKKYIVARQSGTEKSLQVSSKKLNSCFMNGFDWNRIVTIAGLSGVGKSTIAKQWIREILLHNEHNFEVLAFQFEMMGIDEVARDLSFHTGKNIKELYSANEKLKDTFAVDKALEIISKHPVSIVDTHGTVDDIRDTIKNFIYSKKLVENKKNIIVTIDHTLLIKGKDDKATIDDLMLMLIDLKKFIASLGIKSLFFVVSQLNRNIENPERSQNPKLHYPNKTDLFGASSVYFGSDYVIIAHKPCLIDGIGNYYGPAVKGYDSGLPVFNPKDKDQPMIYLHVIKERFGTTKIVPFVDNLKFANIEEFTHTA